MISRNLAIWLLDISSCNLMARLRDYIYYVPTIQLPDEMSGNLMVGTKCPATEWFGYWTAKSLLTGCFLYPKGR